jgi:nicotinate-nucleotide adenylyltransferase
MRRIGLYGGSFNPVHAGHVLVAQAALEELELERVIFIPAAQSPFKPGVPLAPDRLRLQMLRLALAGYPRFEVDPLEIDRGGVSYTIDTVRHYSARLPDASLCYLIGADHVPQLPRWRDSAELAQLVEFIVVGRPGEAAVELPPPFCGRSLRGFPLGLSASQIRDRVRRGQPIDLLVGAPVSEVIRNNRLYLGT